MSIFPDAQEEILNDIFCQFPIAGETTGVIEKNGPLGLRQLAKCRFIPGA